MTHPAHALERVLPEAAPAARRPHLVPAENHLPLHDRERLGALLDSLEPRLRAVALRITRDPEAARDAVQNAFVKVLLHGGRFEGQSRVSTWLHRIVANEALMWLRSERRRRERFEDGVVELERFAAEDEPSAEESLSQREREERLAAALERLPADDRDLLECCALAGESYADYAARRGLGPGALKSRAFRARRRLAELL